MPASRVPGVPGTKNPSTTKYQAKMTKELPRGTVASKLKAIVHHQEFADRRIPGGEPPQDIIPSQHIRTYAETLQQQMQAG